MQMNVGAVFDGRYLYFCAYGHSHMIRYDIQGNFTDDNSWNPMMPTVRRAWIPAASTAVFFDGRYVYFVPWTRTVPAGEDKSTYHANFLRYDTRGSSAIPKAGRRTTPAPPTA